MGWLTGAISTAVAKITGYFQSLFYSLLDAIEAAFYAMIDALWAWFQTLMTAIFAVFDSVIGATDLGWSLESLRADVWPYFRMLNDIFPVMEAFTMLTFYIGAWSVMFIVNWAFRLVPTISGGAGGAS